MPREIVELVYQGLPAKVLARDHLKTDLTQRPANRPRVMSIAIAAGFLAQTPAGAPVDAIRAKRALIAMAALAVMAALLTPLWPSRVIDRAWAQPCQGQLPCGRQART